MKLPINLDSLLKPLSLFLLLALLITGAIYGVLNDEQRAREASNLQKDILSAMPSTMSASSNKSVTWAEAGKQLLALEEKRETATQLFQERFKKAEPKVDRPQTSEGQALKTITVARHAQPIVVADPMDTVKSPTSTINPLAPPKTSKKKTKKRKASSCCRCSVQNKKRKKTDNSCG